MEHRGPVQCSAVTGDGAGASSTRPLLVRPRLSSECEKSDRDCGSKNNSSLHLLLLHSSARAGGVTAAAFPLDHRDPGPAGATPALRTG